jgi:hypothetical protein
MENKVAINNLVSAVMGCECNFIEITDHKRDGKTVYKVLHYEVCKNSDCQTIPLDSFIRLGNELLHHIVNI